ncbi:MAG: zinc ribbon domain-containing protein [Proteobacteria bacterium]|nr:zinc ribbon domain-containing protein [Pseudomonadota bacterium]
MPIYEYKCKKCNSEFDVFQKITEPEIKTCKFCNGPAKKLVSLSTFHLKGSGWYVTDYGGKKAPVGERSKNETETSSASSETDKPAKDESTSKTGSEA